MHNNTLDLRYDRRQAPDLIDLIDGPVNGDLTGESTNPMDVVALTSGIDINFVENNLMNIRYPWMLVVRNATSIQLSSCSSVLQYECPYRS